MPVSGAGFGYPVETATYTDYLFLSNSWMPREITMGGVETDAPCVHLRLEDGVATQAFACEGSELHIDGQELFRAPGTMLAREFTLDQAAPTACTVRNPRRQHMKGT